MFIDLTVAITVTTPVYPGDPPISIAPAARVARDGYSDHILTLPTHAGTHIDAPAHMIENAKTLDMYRPERFIARGVYIDVRSGYDIAAIKAMGIKPGDIVLLHSGMDKRYFEPDYFEAYPALPEVLADYFVSSRVSIVGMDMCGPDYEPYQVHKILLAGDVLILENLTNLGALKDKTFTVYALPIRLDVDGAPARVIAETSMGGSTTGN